MVSQRDRKIPQRKKSTKRLQKVWKNCCKICTDEASEGLAHLNCFMSIIEDEHDMSLQHVQNTTTYDYQMPINRQ